MDATTLPRIAFRDSYLWRLRQTVGHDLVLMPGAMVAVQQADQRVLLTKRIDDRSWCLPAGGRSKWFGPGGVPPGAERGLSRGVAMGRRPPIDGRPRRSSAI